MRPRGSWLIATRCAVFLVCVVSVTGCSAVKPMMLKGVASALSGDSGTAASHDDPELIKGALDFAIVFNESLLASIPKHEPLLTTTCGMYTQYAYGFVFPEAEALQFTDYEKSKPVMARAFKLAQHGRALCWRALEEKFKGITAKLKDDPTAALRKAKREHVQLLYWSAASLGAAISLGGLDHPELVIDWPIVRALAERALELDESWGKGSIHELMITLESQDEAMGGSEARARKHFDRAVVLQQGLSPSPYLSLAMNIAKPKQDRAEFEKLIKLALDVDPDKDPANRLVAVLGKQRAQVLLDHIDEIIPKRPF